MAERFSCARLSRDIDEPLLATASQVRRWVLLEQPGSWGRDALRESHVPSAVAQELERRCRDAGARPLLIRRCGGRDEGVRRALIASSAPGAVWLERVVLDDVAEVLDLDLAPLGEGESVGGQRLTGPVVLTCTNGRHDACCAEYGRGVAAALDEHLGDRAWECSHIGGDRFAANVLCLPEGVYYGRIPADAAVGVAQLHDAGRLSLPHYRGRSVWPFEVQAAETLLRHQLGLDGIDEVVPLTRDRPEQGLAVVVLAAGGRQWRAELEVTADPLAQQLTCDAPRQGHPPRYILRSLVPLPDEQAG